MSVGKTPFAQVMELLPWTSFARTAKRNPGYADMHLNCAKQFHVIALAQLAWRDIKVTPRTNSSALYHDEAPGAGFDRHGLHHGRDDDRSVIKSVTVVPLQRPQIGQDLGVSYQQHQLAVSDHRRALQE
jgi:hypothetical protein